MTRGFAAFANGAYLEVAAIPEGDAAEFAGRVLEAAAQGARLVALFPLQRPGGRTLVALVALDGSGRLAATAGRLGAASAYPSLTPRWPQAQAFERDLWERHGITPEGHPWLKPLRFPALPAGRAIPEGYSYFRADGEEVHEVAVGPVHAGVIEPGHFRFQCHGEEVLHLEIQLGYQHRAAEHFLREAPPARRLVVAESLAGDSVVAHATAHVLAEEALGGVPVPPRAQALRAVALELERLANHAGDLGALAGDVGYLPGASFLGRLRGEFLNLTLSLCGNRTGRGLLTVGGVRFDADGAWIESALARLAVLQRDLADSAELLFGSASVQDRFEGTGVLRREMAEALGLVGPAARASGCRRDVRHDHPAGYFRFAQVTPQVLATGDVYARAKVRWLEMQQSLRFLQEHLPALPPGEVRAETQGPRRPDTLAAGLVEGWRGEAAHVVVSDTAGKTAEYRVTDPSLHNWPGLAMAMRGGAISDFPLCNKSFNLSYAGHDL
ncbi:MAG: NADH-quinone oxidoreductase subunit C [Acidobacteriota bacterium]